MNFKEAHKYADALRWLADGEQVQARMKNAQFADFPRDFSIASSESVLLGEPGWQFRIKPRTVMCNGVEVPAPESVAPEHGGRYCIPVPHASEKFSCFNWNDDRVDNGYLSEGIVYLREEDAIARAKAMLITC